MKHDIVQKALDYFSSGYTCSEAVLKSVAEAKGIDSNTVLPIASAFGSGMARTNGGFCGAFSGGVMALSLLQGRQVPDVPLDRLYRSVADFKERFETLFESCECATLLGFSLSDEHAGEIFKAQNCKVCKCDRFVAFAAEEVERILTRKEP